MSYSDVQKRNWFGGCNFWRTSDSPSDGEHKFPGYKQVHQNNAQPQCIKQINKSSNQPLHNKKKTCLTVTQLPMSTSSSSSCSYSTLSCLSPCCAGSAVSLRLMLAVLALVLAEAFMILKTVGLQHSSPSAHNDLWDFSFVTVECNHYCYMETLYVICK